MAEISYQEAMEYAVLDEEHESSYTCSCNVCRCARIDDLLDSLTMAELRAITESLLLKREYDGLNGRPFDALKHMKYEDRVSDILRIRLRGLKTQNKSEG